MNKSYAKQFKAHWAQYDQNNHVIQYYNRIEIWDDLATFQDESALIRYAAKWAWGK
jgi:hypothetical protein